VNAGTAASGAQATSPSAADVNAGTTGGAAQAASPGAVGPDAGTTVAGAASPKAVDLNTGTTGGAQALNPKAIDLNGGTTVAGAQASGPNAVGLNAGTTGGGTQVASLNTVDLHASTTDSGERAASPFAVELHAGTNGGGAQVEFVFNDYLTGRVSGDWLRISASFNAVNIDTVDLSYSGRANWATAGAFVDLHPLKNGWFLSGGVFQGDRNASFAGAPTSNVIIDGYTFTPADIGTVMGEGKLPSTSPFVGIGWDQAQHDRSGLTFRILGGAAFGGAKVTLWDVGPYSDTPPVQQWIAQEQAYVQSKVDAWKAYPVVQIGIGYRF
jgi:hypothetical protein